MDHSAPAAALSIGDQLPWLARTFRQTEQVAALIPPELMDWRPPDPSGRWSFSLAEIAMHCADIRLMFARQLRGEDSSVLYWLDSPKDSSGIWTRRREPAGPQEIVASLAAGREELEPWMALPYEQTLTATAGMQQSFLQYLASQREKGQDTSEAERRGPSTLNRIFFTVACHEAGHRGALQALLRLHGLGIGSE
ncbi:DinB family protein [bacterium]|nr:DinB family protein [bacterium]